MRVSRLVAGLLAQSAVVALGVRPAFAAPLPIRVIVRDAGPCPDAALVEQKLLERNPGWTRPAEGVPARDVRIQLKSEVGQIHGHLELVQANGELHARSVTGADCAEVVDAIVFMTSVLVAASEPDHAPHTPVPRASAVGEGAAEESFRLRALFGATLALAFGVLPGPAVFPRALVGAEFARGRSLPIASLRLSFAYATSASDLHARSTSSIVPTDQQAPGISPRVISLRLNSQALIGRGEGCGPRLGRQELAAEGCGLFELGRLSGTASGFDVPESHSALWSTAGLLARVLWRPWRPLRFELEAGAVAVLTRVRFRLDAPGSPEAWRTPDFGAFAGISLGLTFP